MNTIVQEYGPIYGEPVNGTVQGRPNGSVYVPLSNKIVLSIAESFRYMVLDTYLIISNSAGQVSPTRGYQVTADSQDLASNVHLEVYADAELTTQVGFVDFTAGTFNLFNRIFRVIGEPSFENEQPLYIIGYLMNNNTPVATSDAIEVQMVVTEE